MHGEPRGAAAACVWDEQSHMGFWKSRCSSSTSKKSPTLTWLDTNGNFLGPSRLSFLGLAGEMEVSEQPRGLRSLPCSALHWAQTPGPPAVPTSRAANSPARMKGKCLTKILTT